MKLATFTALAVLFSAGYAFAGAGAPVPEGSQSGQPSGRPSAVLDDERVKAYGRWPRRTATLWQAIRPCRIS